MDNLLTFAEKVKLLVSQGDPDLRDKRIFVIDPSGDRRYRIEDIGFDSDKNAVTIRLK